MESYETLLDKAYQKVKVISSSEGRFEVPKVSGLVSGKNTIINNIKNIADHIRRPVEQFTKFLLKELATSGKLEKERLILNTKLNSEKVNEKVMLYVKEFVICPVCSKPDTEIISERSIKLKHCLACGAKSPIKQKI